MIEVTEVVAGALCRNCLNRISLCQSDLRTEPFWTHDETMRESCPNAPTAAPAPSTVTHVQQPVVPTIPRQTVEKPTPPAAATGVVVPCAFGNDHDDPPFPGACCGCGFEAPR